MSKRRRAEKRKARKVRKALGSVLIVRDGVREMKISKSTFHHRCQKMRNPRAPKEHNRLALSDEEGKFICDKIKSFADLGKPCTTINVLDIF